MTRHVRLEVLLDSGKLEERAFGDDDVVGLWSKAIEAYKDSLIRGRSRNGQFRDLYEAARLAASAFAAADGLRAKGEGHHRSAFLAGSLLSSEEVSVAFITIEGLRTQRHDTNYGSVDVIDADAVSAMRKEVETLLELGAKQLRKLRPSCHTRIRITKRPRAATESAPDSGVGAEAAPAEENPGGSGR